MLNTRLVARPVLFLAGLALAAVSGCMPPVAFHDGLPAWVMEPRGVEARVGCNRLSVVNGDPIDVLEDTLSTPAYGLNYLTPGIRFGLGTDPVSAEVGLTSVVILGDGYLATAAGPEFGIGYRSTDMDFTLRPSLYLLGINSDESGTKVQTTGWWQLSALAGTGYQGEGLSLAAGARFSQLAIGPIAVVGYALSPVEFRCELSYMFPASYAQVGQTLTFGLTVAAPTPRRTY